MTRQTYVGNSRLFFRWWVPPWPPTSSTTNPPTPNATHHPIPTPSPTQYTHSPPTNLHPSTPHHSIRILFKSEKARVRNTDYLHTVSTVQCTVHDYKGGVIFKRKKLDTCHAVSNCFRTPIPKFAFFNVVFNFAQGLQKF